MALPRTDDDRPSPLTQAVVDALASEVAVLDAAGRVLLTNIAWEERIVHGADRSGAWVACGTDDDYLVRLAISREPDAEAARAGVSAVLEGSLRTFGLDYVAEVDGDRRRFHLEARSLPGGVPGVLVEHRDVTARAKLEEQLVVSATTDGLTGLPNRGLLQDRLRGALARAQRTQHVVAVLSVDIDAFTAVNETLGRDAGDQVLVSVARRLSRACRTGDTVARLGGDEFVVLVEDVDAESSVHGVARRILESMAAPIVVAGSELWFSVSIGVAIASAQTVPTTAGADELVADADIALYRAKERGRNRYVLFEPSMRAHEEQRLMVSTGLRQALRDGHLHLAYQPVFACADDRVLGVEALVRWDRPGHGVMAPATFLDVAEEPGVLVVLGAWVLDEACRQAREWQRIAPSDFVVGVNMSPRQLADPGAPALVRKALQRHGVDPFRIALEVNERALVDDPERARRTLHEILGFGVKVAVDQFGSGYSSLAYLQRFPVGAIKIDRRFVALLPDDRTSSALVRGMVGMADALGIITVAEGVETEAQREAVERLGCHSYQGYLKARPGHPDTITTLLQTTT